MPFESIEQFIMEYAQMRDAQKRYFRLKYYSDLKEAQRRERELDEKCRQYMKQKALQSQTDLFKQGN